MVETTPTACPFSFFDVSKMPESANKLKAILERSTDADEYAKAVLVVDLIKQLNEKCLAMESAEELKKFVEKYFLENEIKDETDIKEMVATLFAIYLRENMVGPSVYSVYVEEILAPIDDKAPKIESLLDGLSSKNVALQKSLLKHFERDSE